MTIMVADDALIDVCKKKKQETRNKMNYDHFASMADSLERTNRNELSASTSEWLFSLQHFA